MITNPQKLFVVIMEIQPLLFREMRKQSMEFKEEEKE